MQSIGERLEDARKRKGISLREAAEGTKIRSDFLGYIEQNKFDFDLPELYKRGFIKNYARYLKLDPETIITDYSAQLLGDTRDSSGSGKKGGSELFGQIDAKSSSQSEDAPHGNSGSYGRISSRPSSSSSNSNKGSTERDDRDLGDDEADKTFYLKIGLVFIGTLTLVFVIFGLIKAILSSGDEIATEPNLNQPTEITESANSGGEVASPNEITLVANGTVYVLVRQQSDDSILYQETMSEGDSIVIAKNGAVDILFTAGENLTIESGGERFRPSSSGTAKITLP